MRGSTQHFVVGGIPFGGACALAALVLAAAVAASPGAQDQVPTFRSSVDVIAVDVQVVDDDGTPIPNLGPEDFEVSISGDRRQVVSADYIRSTTIDGRPLSRTSGPVATNLWPLEPDTPQGRVYILAFDVGSLTVSDSRSVAESARAFTDRLMPNDFIGVYTFPIGRWLEPTTDRVALHQALNRVVGSGGHAIGGRFNLSMSEIIDINAEMSGGMGGVLAAVAARECPEIGIGCVPQIQVEAQSVAFYFEGRATESLNGMRALIDSLGSYEGRKTVVMFSSGMPTSDRGGIRPDVGELPRLLGQDAATTNTSIYTVYVDSGEFRAMAAETRRMVGTPAQRSRDLAVGSRIMEEFTGASGGAFARVLSGAGEVALDRVLRETSSHYLLGVQPEPADRNGRVRQLRVKVDVDDVTVRSRSWVIVPPVEP